MNGNDHNRWSEDLAAYALGALGPSEAAEFERHLEGCEQCRRELRWFEPAVQVLPESVERQEPPPQLRAALMAEVRADAEAQAPARPEKRRSWSWFARPAMAFAVIVLAVAVVAGYEIGKGGSGDSGSPTVLTTSEHGIEVKMVTEGDGGTLHLAHLHQLPPDKVLEAWVRREGTVEPVPALLVPDRKGQAETTIADMSGVDTVMVTEEPQGGSEAPTGEAIVTMAVPQ
ncbi:MAG TPA: anti-sigma factor [Solirubrobacterales bacterium]|nr:anti-sigma factor [Solirubrobacterales bacterium]